MKPLKPHCRKDEFLKKLDQELERNIGAPDFTVDAMLGIVYMSRTNFHRRLKEATGLSATAYLRAKRLKKAKQLLAERPDMPVGLVAIEVGFGSQSYFTRKFREMYGVRPGEVRSGGEG
jgi:AraC-like DNA-binding protein